MSTQALEFEVFSLFPALVEAVCGAGLLGKARDRDLVRVHCTDIRAFATDKHRTVDDAPFGGGAGMLMRPDVVVAALEHVEHERGPFHRILLTPSAPTFDQAAAQRLAGYARIGLLCGRYEGIDDRVREHYVDECLSIGDFVLNGGEVAAAAIIEAVARLREGVLGNPASARDDSFSDPRRGSLLEHPHYTRPAKFRGHEVAPVLLGGDHESVARWRRVWAGWRTWALRPRLRPHRTLDRTHPVWLAVDDEPGTRGVEELSPMRAVGKVVRARTRGAVVREVRRATGRVPWIAGLGECVSHAWPSVGSLPALLDLLDLAEAEPVTEPRPLVFAWPEPFARSLGACVWFAPNPQGGEARSPPGLATDPSMTDISQPRSGEQLAALARRLDQALQAPGPDRGPS